VYYKNIYIYSVPGIREQILQRGILK